MFIDCYGTIAREPDMLPQRTLPGVLSIAVSVAACTLVFGLMEALLWTPLPYDEAERLVLFRSQNLRLGETRPYVSVADFQDWRRETTSFEEMALFHWTQLDLWGERGGETERVEGLAVTPEFFSVMGLTAAAGEMPAPGSPLLEARADIIVLGRPLWNRRYGADRSVVGETIAIGTWTSLPQIGPVPYRVAGVSSEPSRFLPVSRGVGRKPVGVDDLVDFWVPFTIEGDVDPVPPRQDRGFFGAVARLKAGVSPEAARAELDTVAARLAARYPATNGDWTATLEPLRESIVGTIRPALWLLFAGGLLLFLVACSNLCSLQIVRTVKRRRELAVRAALGASTARLFRSLAAETMSLAAWGGALGLGLAAIGFRLLPSIAPPDVPRLDAFHLDSRAVLFGIGLVATAGLLAATGPVWLLVRDRRAGALESHLRATTGSASPGGQRILRIVASLAVTMALVLLIGAGLLHQSLSRLLGVDPGYERENLLTLTMSLPESRYAWQRNTEFLHEVVDRVGELPGIAAAGAVRGMPGRESRIETPVFLPVSGDAAPPPLLVQTRLVNRTYFEAMGIPVLAGRSFEPPDESGEIGFSEVVLVNRTLAERLWPNESAVGQRFHVVRHDLPPVEVVGVVGDVRYYGLEQPPVSEIYYPEALFPQAETDLILRTSGPPAAMSALVQEAIRSIEPGVILSNVASMEEILRETVAERRFAFWLLGGFSSAALLLAAIGVAGVMSQNVSQRQEELGIRLALGAPPRRIMGMVLVEGLLLTGVGITAGVLAAGAGTRLLSRFLFEIEPTDAATFVAAALVTAATATFASLLPCRNAAGTDPLRALRQD